MPEFDKSAAQSAVPGPMPGQMSASAPAPAGERGAAPSGTTGGQGSETPVSGESAPRPAWSQDIKSYYDKVAEEPIPDSFANLMADLARTMRK